MKKWKRIAAMGAAMLLIVSGCAKKAPASEYSHDDVDNIYDYIDDYEPLEDIARFSRDAGTVDYSGIVFTPWEADITRLPEQPVKKYTVMVYMNGSDLESHEGLATKDIVEMLESGVDTDNVNVLLFTGGTNRWRNNVVPENECMIWRIIDGRISPVTGVGLVNMGDPGTLSCFINFSMRNFPAEKYGLILWDHGGGSIAGYGSDEKFNESGLTLLEMNYAFEKSDLSRNKLEFLGFDACLMATVEMAVVAAPYSRYLVASQDLEPGDGWNYSFFSIFNNEQVDGARVGGEIVDAYIDYYGPRTNEYLTLSVTDLSRVDMIMDAMGRLMGRCSLWLLADRASSFNALSRRRGNTKSFGNGSPLDNDCDMVDIGDMAYKLSDLFPDEAGQLLSALEHAVIYNRHNSQADLKGLTAFYIYFGKEYAQYSLQTYKSLNMSEEYSGYLYSFADILNADSLDGRNGTVRSHGVDVKEGVEYICAHLTAWRPVDEKPGYYSMIGIQDDSGMGDGSPEESGGVLWPSIGGEPVCMHKLQSSAKNSLYAIPASLNGCDVDIIVRVSAEHPEGKVLGARHEEGFIIQKGYDEIKQGDKLSFYHKVKCFEDEREEPGEWLQGKELTVKKDLGIEWGSLGENDICVKMLVDTQQNVHFIMIPRPFGRFEKSDTPRLQ